MGDDYGNSLVGKTAKNSRIFLDLPTTVTVPIIGMPSDYHIYIHYRSELDQVFSKVIDGKDGDVSRANPCVRKNEQDQVVSTAFTLSYVLPYQRKAFLRINFIDHLDTLRNIFEIFDNNWPGCFAHLTGIGLDQNTPLSFRYKQTPPEQIETLLGLIGYTPTECQLECGYPGLCFCEETMLCPMYYTKVTVFELGTPVPSCLPPYSCIGSAFYGTCVFVENLDQYTLGRAHLDFYNSKTIDFILGVLLPFISVCMLSPQFIFSDISNSTVVVYGAMTNTMRSQQMCGYSSLATLGEQNNFFIYSYTPYVRGYNFTRCASVSKSEQFRPVILPPMPDPRNLFKWLNFPTQLVTPGLMHCGTVPLVDGKIVENGGDDDDDDGNDDDNDNGEWISSNTVRDDNNLDSTTLNTAGLAGGSGTSSNGNGDGSTTQRNEFTQNQIPLTPEELEELLNNTADCSQIKCSMWTSCLIDDDCIYGLCTNNVCQLYEVMTNDFSLLNPRLEVYYTQKARSDGYFYDLLLLKKQKSQMRQAMKQSIKQPAERKLSRTLFRPANVIDNGVQRESFGSLVALCVLFAMILTGGS
jgi:hypothetical protein